MFLVCFVVASLTIYPHSISFFNIAAGGPKSGPKHLHNSNVDWGQDLLLLAEWAKQNPEARPLKIAFSGGFPASALPVWDEAVSCGEPSSSEYNAILSGDAPDCWYAFSVGLLYDPPFDSPRRFFRLREPDKRIGYSIHLYHLGSTPKR